MAHCSPLCWGLRIETFSYWDAASWESNCSPLCWGLRIETGYEVITDNDIVIAVPFVGG
ncbi:hypothetical protein HSACCH_00578 [Halanaerobium saccharolyticum subsp. saccharolyticum DSM 6643]|uniref:Uncharacterized protein n=1 Tax=Halanaerobium saccharolyticum subsp. saccharolyticum DSM 6643 TaxID=1293054 RepID=M5DZ79_9FIRM|nr:hypothetical protein HSACCH_00578 [Halanaerobium saccharolyticum subsp. saccharolyticum DSM 6643]